MKKLGLFIVLLLFTIFSLPSTTYANHIGVQGKCDPNASGGHCRDGLLCQRVTADQGGLKAGDYGCFNTESGPGGGPSTGSIFGKITPPEAIINLGFGATGISKFLNNAITLIYIVATIVFVFMLLWGALSWLTSGGDKEKVTGAQKTITSAIIGLMLFAVAFAIIRLLGTFTGFSFFQGT